MLKLKLLTSPPLPPKGPLRRRTLIRLDAPVARSVAVTGDFCGWEPTGRPLTRAADGEWRTTLLLLPGTYEYRFRVDGEWVSNPSGSAINFVLRVEPRSPTQKRAPMNQTDLAGYRKTLQGLSARLARALAHDHRELLRLDDPDLPTGPMPSTEDEPNAGLHEIGVGLIASESGLLAEVTAALARIDAGTFGRCEGCSKTITRIRLDAVPYARYCIRCAKVGRRAVAGPAVG